MSQESCLDCYRKHIATAMSFEDEATIGYGYPLHKWYAIGEMNAAAKEVVKEYPVLAGITRDYCKSYQLDDISLPTDELIRLSLEIEADENKEEKGEENLKT